MKGYHGAIFSYKPVSGLEILEFLKKEEMPTKVIVVSCQEEFDVVKKAMKLGAYDYLRKLNLSSNELENILEKCLGETEERITVLEQDDETSLFHLYGMKQEEWKLTVYWRKIQRSCPGLRK